MEAAYDGRQVVGMDLHRRRSALVRMTEDRRRLGSARLANSPAELGKEIAKAGVAQRVVLAATYGWYWPRMRWRPRGRRCIWRIRWGSRRSPTGG